MVLARAAQPLAAFAGAYRLADRGEVESGMERKLLILGSDHRDGGVRGDVLETDPAVVGLVVVLPRAPGLRLRLEHEGAGERVQPAQQQHRQHGDQQPGQEQRSQPVQQAPRDAAALARGTGAAAQAGGRARQARGQAARRAARAAPR
jgi:hypothetical protein